jgi:hypothetical protein
LKEAYQRLNVYLMQISDIIAQEAKLYKYPVSAGFSIFELLNNAFVDGNHLNWEFPVYIKVDSQNKIIEVFDLDLESLLGMKSDQEAKSESEDILHDPVKGLKQIKFSLEKEAVESEGRVVGAKTKVNFARETTKGLTIIQGGRRVDQAMASFRSFGDLKITLRQNPEFFQEEGGSLVAFDMDEASKIEPSQQEGEIGISNNIILDAFPRQAVKVFSTARTSSFLYKEEGYIYIPNKISEKELRDGLQNVSNRLSETGKTMSFAVIKGSDLGAYIAANSIKSVSLESNMDIMEDLFANLLRMAKGEKGSTDYGNNTVFYDPNGGIDLTPANMNLQVKNDASEGIKFHLDPAMLAQLKNAPGFVPVIINIQPLNDLKSFLGIVNQT